MSGIYIHIPFCKQVCSYCNFHFTVNLNHKDSFIKAVLREVDLRKEYLKDAQIETVYFGGGTPSLLTAEDLNKIFEKLHQSFKMSQTAEITLEANPDDLTETKIRELRATPVNRFSIGIQSFYDDNLQLLNRAHNAEQAETSVKLAQDTGFENITIDLIYGIPGKGKEQTATNQSSNEKWLNNLEKLKKLNIPHFSAYCLTIEQKTVLEKMIREGKAPDVNEADAASQFEMLMDFALANGYDHYEISNFAKPGYYSHHNSSYWTGKHYLGLGPSAHSYDGKSRQWNIANNTLYIQSLLKGELVFEREELTDNDRFNEYVMTALRTKGGIDIAYLKAQFGDERAGMLEKNSAKFLDDSLLIDEAEKLKLTQKGKLIADRIICDLFETEN